MNCQMRLKFRKSGNIVPKMCNSNLGTTTDSAVHQCMNLKILHLRKVLNEVGTVLP